MGHCDITVFIVIYLISTVVYGGIPISNSLDDTWSRVYNLIDTDPRCYYNGICPMFEPGSKLAAFPNSEEKQQGIMHNHFRLFANQTLNTSYGRYLYNANDAVETYYGGGYYCGSTKASRRPLYWYSDANQAARYKQWDEDQCDPCYFYDINDKCNQSHPDFTRTECYPAVSGHTGCGHASPHDTWYMIYNYICCYMFCVYK